MTETTVAIRARLEKDPDADPFWVKQATERLDWAIDGYLGGYIEKERLDAEAELFREDADYLLNVAAIRRSFSLVDLLDMSDEERAIARETRRVKWQQQEAEAAAQREVRHQRAKLREGHQTLTAIRRYLRGQDRSPLPASRPARTSPTS
jgi:hypothetical protein